MQPSQRLFAGPPIDGHAELLTEHHRRLGHLPALPADQVIAALEATGMLGRGGAGFPVGRKWRAIHDQPGGRTPVIGRLGLPRAPGRPGPARL